ncbi:MAG: MerR family transcriptional regulator [Propionibacterium sp.]|nr:MerR family transcriptional regulator [Propionibacterium sp.]
MDDDKDELLRIGVFSVLSRISVRMLRHYQQEGVLEPVWVDTFTGYRYYHPSQLREAATITQLRDAGLPVAQIVRVLDLLDDPPGVRAILDEHRHRLESEQAALDHRLGALDLFQSRLTEVPMDIDVHTTTLPAMTLASLRHTIPTYGDEGVLWQELMPLLARSGAEFAPEGISGATFHDPGYRDRDVDVEVWVQVQGPGDPVEGLTFQELPERRVVTATLRGDYSQMAAVTEAIGDHIATHHLDTGAMFNIYRVSPAQDPDPAHWVTEVCFPVID